MKGGVLGVGDILCEAASVSIRCCSLRREQCSYHQPTRYPALFEFMGVQVKVWVRTYSSKQSEIVNSFEAEASTKGDAHSNRGQLRRILRRTRRTRPALRTA